MITNWREAVTISLADALAAQLGAGLSRSEAEDACADDGHPVKVNYRDRDELSVQIHLGDETIG